MRLILVNADTAEDIREIEEGGSLSILVHPFVTIRVEDVEGAPVTFRDNDRAVFVAEEGAPFTITEAAGDGFEPYPLTIGEHTFEVEGDEAHTLGLTVTVDAEEPEEPTEPEPEEPEPTPEPEPAPEPTPEEPEEPPVPEPTPEPEPEPQPEPQPEPEPEPTPEPEEPAEPDEPEAPEPSKGKHRRKPGQRIIDSGLYAAYDADGQPVPGEGQPLAATFRKGTTAPPIRGVSGGFWQLEQDTNPHDRASRKRNR